MHSSDCSKGPGSSGMGRPAMSLTSRAARCAAGLGVLAALLPLAAVAQLEEIVVTTRKREESLQELPIAVNAITEQQIQRLGITDLDDVAKLSPSVQFDNSYSPSDNRVTIRGLSNTRGRSNVAFLVDGIDVTTENLISAGSGLLANRRLLSDVERIEVVKGPQSALYGRAAFSGAISYITKEPSDEFEGSLRVNAAEDGFYQVDGAVGGPVFGDTFGLRLNGVYYNDDGHYINTVSGSQVGGSEGYGAALVGLFTPSDSLRIKARVEYSDDEYDPRPFVRVGGGRNRKYPDWAVAPFDPNITKTYVAPVFDSQGNLVAGTGLGNLIGKGSNPTFLGLVDHGLANLAPLDECPPEFRDAYAQLGGCPGFYLPHSYGSGKKERIAQC